MLPSDNGPEFVAFELTEWLAELGGAAAFHIEPGKPSQNGLEEFWSLPHARALIEARRIEYNSEHLRSSLAT